MEGCAGAKPRVYHRTLRSGSSVLPGRSHRVAMVLAALLAAGVGVAAVRCRASLLRALADIVGG